jgi:8-oxo-dGTP pyrophosphatase MutT (NUDIX family)
VTIEIPGGVVDPGELPERAALRELEEETGYGADRLVHIGSMNPNPAFMGNTVHTFAATGVRIVGDQKLDRNEQADVLLLPETEVLQLNHAEFTAHAIMVAAVYWYRLYLEDGLSYAQRVGL